MTKKERYEKVLAWFKQNMGKVETELHYGNPFQLLVAVMLSAQCTDKRVNMVTPALFAAYPDALAMSKASEEEILSYVKSVTYPNAKAKHLLETAKIVAESYGGEVPDDDKLLQKLPGVGRKTAHVVQAVLFNRPEMPVDTHVFRVSARIGLTTNAKNVLQTEKQLVKYIPQADIPDAHHYLILHGRYVCTARSPKCANCGISAYCVFYQQNTNIG
ncbi:MAG: endonuclease III [Bacteroidales bacterium]|nr:endonuclease III [Bacteroidales bacterium]